MMVWSEFGRPNESVWKPAEQDAGSPNHGLYPGGYYLFAAQPSSSLQASIAENEKTRLAGSKTEEAQKPKLVSWKDSPEKLWKGWVLPASDADTWFVAGSAAYYRTLAAEDVDKVVNALRVRYRGLKLAETTTANRVRLQETEGALFLDQLRHKLGDEPFLKLMNDYFAQNTTKSVTAQSFLAFAKIPFTVPEPGPGPAYLSSDIDSRLDNAVIVYGTTREAGVNRYVAEALQVRYRERAQIEVPIYRDFDATDALLAHKDVIFVGRPETDSALAAWSQKIGLDYPAAQFKLDGKTYASERSALVYAGTSPLDAKHMILVYAGNSPLETARSLEAGPAVPAPWFALQDGKN
jgi:hypothetical protein